MSFLFALTSFESGNDGHGFFFVIYIHSAKRHYLAWTICSSNNSVNERLTFVADTKMDLQLTASGGYILESKKLTSKASLITFDQ
jgi:hypothetical protein